MSPRLRLIFWQNVEVVANTSPTVERALSPAVKSSSCQVIKLSSHLHLHITVGTKLLQKAVPLVGPQETNM